MKMMISENIKTFRKERKLTQEQLAEALGVTIGAVSKWESALSVPDISLIIELAHFFETSIDVLIGYDMKQSNLGNTLESIKNFRRKKQFDQGIKEVDLAIKKYPNHFDLIYECAIFYALLGVEQKSEKAFERSLDLYSRSIELLSQNTNKDVSEVSIKNEIANIYILLNKHDKAIELLKENNVCGINNATIGYSLSLKKETAQEALTYLSNAFLHSMINDAFRMFIGYSNAYFHTNQIKESINSLEWFIALLQNSRKSADVTYLDKLEGICLTSIANFYVEIKNNEKAKSALEHAIMLGKRFDESPKYTMDGICFYHGSGKEIAYDDFGDSFLKELYQRATEEEKTSHIIKSLWEEITNENEK